MVSSLLTRRCLHCQIDPAVLFIPVGFLFPALHASRGGTAQQRISCCTPQQPSFDAHGDELTMVMIMLPANCHAKANTSLKPNLVNRTR
jgi:hypothetical protein